jgi:flagellar basal body-associated protein FliL
MEDPQNRNKKGKSVWVPLLAIGAVALLGGVGLVRGCSYAAEEPAFHNSTNGTRDAPDA